MYLVYVAGEINSFSVTQTMKNKSDLISLVTNLNDCTDADSNTLFITSSCASAPELKHLYGQEETVKNLSLYVNPATVKGCQCLIVVQKELRCELPIDIRGELASALEIGLPILFWDYKYVVLNRLLASVQSNKEEYNLMMIDEEDNQDTSISM